LPYSYKGASLSQAPGSGASPAPGSHPMFTFSGYSVCDSTPPGSVAPTGAPLPAICSRRTLGQDVATLNNEIASINSVRPDDSIPISVLGFGVGGAYGPPSS